MHITNCGRGVHKREVVGIDRLSKGLPGHWYGFTNLDLATGAGRSREIDLILVADDRIFLIDLKDWDGRIDSDNGNWLHNGRDTGASPVGKIHKNAKDLGYLLQTHVKKYMPGILAPRVIGIVVITGNADLSGISVTEAGAVFRDRDLIAKIAKPGPRVDTFGAVSPKFVATPLTEHVWKDQLGKFFNARTGPLRPGQRRYGPFSAASDHAVFEHPERIYSEYEAFDEAAAQSLGTLRVWDFTKAETRFQSEEARREIAGRERSVVEYLKDRSDACETAILHPRAEDPERGVNYWEVYERRQRLRRLSEFVRAETEGLDRSRRVELSRQIISRVASLHAADAAHLDLGGHSIWLEAPSNVKLSHLMAAQFAQVESLGAGRYQFLASSRLPEDVLGCESTAKRRDVFLLAVAVHTLLFGDGPATSGDEVPGWDPAVDVARTYEPFNEWFERALAIDPQDRFRDATEALDAFNAASADEPNERAVIEGLERFRGAVRSQKQLYASYPEDVNLKETDRIEVWRGKRGETPVLVKLWKREAWGDQTREGAHILDFLNRARELALSPPPSCGRVLDAHWLGDGFAIVQGWVEGPDLAAALASAVFGEAGICPLTFSLQLANVVDTLHGRGWAHGDLKPKNIIVSADDENRPVLIDLLDFSPSRDGDIQTNAYAPERGGRMERDRYAVTCIVAELLSTAAISPPAAAAIAAAITTCRTTFPENGTLLPLIEALERSLAPPTSERPASHLRLVISGASGGPFLSDEGKFFIRKGYGQVFYLRGACEEIEVVLDDTGRPFRARRRPLDQSRIGRLAKLEFMAIEAEISVTGGGITDLSSLQPLLEEPAFVQGWAGGSMPLKPTRAPEEAAEAGEEQPAFEDAAFDAIAEADRPSTTTESIDVRRLWRALIDAESELTTDGVALADSAYSRDLRRHIVPFELTSGTFEFNRNDRVGVERLGRKGVWRRIGELDIIRSKPDRILIDASELAFAHQAGLVEGEQRLRFTSHFQVQSLQRRQTAISRILDGKGRIPDLFAAFAPGTEARPQLLPLEAQPNDLAPYKLNPTQEAAFQKLLAVRPLGALQGPPGTGKTHFISALVHYVLSRGLARNVLLASQSHEAVNNAAEAVLRLFEGQDAQPSILRVGNEGVVSSRLLPFHTDRMEALYKDRFRAGARDRLRMIGQALGLPDVIVDVVIDVEAKLRPIAASLASLQSTKEPDVVRVQGLADTLALRAEEMAGAPIHPLDEDPLSTLDAVITEAVSRLPARQRPAADRIQKLRSIAQLGRDFVGSVSTQQRGFETFLAGTRQIVAGTCVGLGRTSLGLTTTPFDLVIIDEAARCTASELAVPMQAGRWVVLVGDHAQLEPQHHASVVSTVAAEERATEIEVIRSDFERLFENGYGTAAGALLKTQYRMLPPIGRVVSDTFYGGKLEPGRSEPEVDPAILPPDLDRPITWLSTDCLGELGRERLEETGTSRINPAEADAIATTLKRWSQHKPFASWVSTQTKHSHAIGIICMYAAQRDLVRRKLQAANLPEAFRQAMKIDTVDSYQGKQNPIVMLSLVRNNTEGRLEHGIATIRPGFLRRPNRVNVAVSRAMDRLIIVGAKSRWRAESPMATLAEAVEKEFQAGHAKVVPVSSIQPEAGAQEVLRARAGGGVR